MGNSKELNIKSSTIEKGLDLTKDFLGKLITPTIEEAGLLIKDQMTMLRFRSQVRMLEKTRIICERNGIKTKNIPLKLVNPILDFAGLEEDEVLHDKWAILLSNMVDSEQNVQNHVFPYILSQLSKNEFEILSEICEARVKSNKEIESEYKTYLENNEKKANDLKSQIESIKKGMSSYVDYIMGKLDPAEKDNYLIATKKISELENEFYPIKNKERQFLALLSLPEEISTKNLQNFEVSNLIRLGLIEVSHEFKAARQRLEIPKERNDDLIGRYEKHTKVDFDINANIFSKKLVTELGFMFFKACSEKEVK